MIMKLIGAWLARDKIVYTAIGPSGKFIVRRHHGNFYVHEVQGSHEIYRGGFERYVPAVLHADTQAR